MSGGKQLIRTLEVDKYIISNELVGTTNWVYHYDISAQFSLRHWRRKEMKMTDDPQPPKQVTVRDNTTAMAAIVKKISGVRDSPD